MKLPFYGTIILASIFLASCASIMSGTTQQVTFQSTPDGALVKIDGKPLGKTPLTIQLDKKDQQTLSIEKDGYITFTTSMDTSLDPWFWGNILIGGLLGSTTDSVNGSVHEYSPGQYFITLEPLSLSQTPSELHLSQKENAKRFLFLNYEKLKSDLSKSSGETIDATLEILNINDNERTSAINQLKDSIFEQDNPSEFIAKTIELYLG